MENVMSSFTSKFVGIGSRCINLSRSCIFALAGVAVLAAPSAWAHIDPLMAGATGITISTDVLRNDGSTPVLLGDTVSQCETINLRSTLSWAGTNNAAFESGTWTITIPDGAGGETTVDVTPIGGVPCIGGGIDDPNSVALNDGRGICLGSNTSVQSVLVPYTVTAADIAGGFLMAGSGLADAFAHGGITDLPGVNATSPITIAVEICNDDLFCNGVETCDPALGDGVVLGQCVPGTPPVCATGECFSEVCDDVADACVRSDANSGDVCSDFPDSNACIPDICIGGECVANGDTDEEELCLADDFECYDLTCNTSSGLCTDSNDINTGDLCTDFPDSNACIPDICIGGVCVPNNGTPVVCDPETEVCTDLVCTEATGVCDPVPVNEGEVCGEDGNLCLPDLCDDAGVCVPNNGTPTDCDDLNVCTDDSCNTETGECVNVDNQSCDVPPVQPIPTLSVGGLVAMILTMLGLGGILIRRRLLSKATRV
jgi:hypothetical protein